MVRSIRSAPHLPFFVGPTETITTTASQELLSAVQTPMGAMSSNPRVIYNSCYQPNGGGAISHFSGSNTSIYRHKHDNDGADNRFGNCRAGRGDVKGRLLRQYRDGHSHNRQTGVRQRVGAVVD